MNVYLHSVLIKTNNPQKSCGCIREKNHSEEVFKFNINGEEKEIKILEKLNKKCGNKFYYKCLCFCGKEFDCLYGNLKTEKKKSCGCSRRGKNSPRWNPNREEVKLNKEFQMLFNKIRNYIKIKNYIEYEKIMDEPLKLMLKHLESFKEKGYDWRNGSEYHIDHIFPRCAFAKYGIKDPKIINCRENLQILTKEDNLKKGYDYNKIEFYKYLLKHNINIQQSLYTSIGGL